MAAFLSCLKLVTKMGHLGTSCNVFGISYVFQSHLGTNWYVATTSQIGRFYQGIIYEDVDV